MPDDLNIEWRITCQVVQTLDTTISGSFTTGSTFDSSGNFYVTTFDGGYVSKFDQDGNLMDAQFAECDPGANCESIVFDKAGNFYVGQAETADILKFDSDGNLIQRYDVQTSARGSDWIDLAADQSTMYYTSFEVYTFDLETGVQGPQFATLPTVRRLHCGFLMMAAFSLLIAPTSNV